MEQNSINKKAGKAVAWSFLTQALSKLVSPVVNIVLARLLAPEAFGAVATINIVITFAEIFTDAGFQKYIVQHEFDNDDDLNKGTNVAFWTNTIVSLLFISAICVARNGLAELVGSPDLGIPIALSSINILLVTFCSTQTARFNRDMDFKTLFYTRVCTVFVPLLVTVPLAFFIRNYWALLIGTFAVNLINAIILTIFSKWKPSFNFDFGVFKEMFSFSAWILLDAVTVWLTTYIGTFIVGRYLDTYHLGLYKTAMTTSNQLTSILTTAITPVMFSQLSRYQNNDEKMKSTFYTYQRLSAIVLFPLGVGMFLYRDFLRMVLLGSQWGEATEFLGLWGLMSSVVIVFSNYCSTFYRSKGKPKLSLISQLIYLCVLIPTLLISVQFGFRALYYARSLVMLYSMIQATIIMKVFFNFKVFQTILNVLPVIISSVFMVVVALLLQQFGDSVLWQVISIGMCVIVYFSCLLLFPKNRKEILKIPVVNKIINKLKKVILNNV